MGTDEHMFIINETVCIIIPLFALSLVDQESQQPARISDLTLNILKLNLYSCKYPGNYTC